MGKPLTVMQTTVSLMKKKNWDALLKGLQDPHSNIHRLDHEACAWIAKDGLKSIEKCCRTNKKGGGLEAAIPMANFMKEWMEEHSAPIEIDRPQFLSTMEAVWDKSHACRKPGKKRGDLANSWFGIAHKLKGAFGGRVENAGGLESIRKITADGVYHHAVTGKWGDNVAETVVHMVGDCGAIVSESERDPIVDAILVMEELFAQIWGPVPQSQSGIFFVAERCGRKNLGQRLDPIGNLCLTKAQHCVNWKNFEAAYKWLEYLKMLGLHCGLQLNDRLLQWFADLESQIQGKVEL